MSFVMSSCLFLFVLCVFSPLLPFIQALEHKSIPPVHFRPKIRSSLNNNTASNKSVYICQNSSWSQPCRLIPLYPENNGQQDFWMAPAPGGPGPYGTGNYTVGSWGPSPGVTTFWVDHQGNTSDLLKFPGTGAVDPYWADNIWTWYAYWDENE